MFLNTSILTKLMKAAYKSTGLIVCQNKEDLYLAGSYWEASIKNGFSG